MDLGPVTHGIFSVLLIAPVYVLAVMRLTRLINSDTVLDWLRMIPANKSHAARIKAGKARSSGQRETAVVFDKAAERWSTVLYFLECPWCIGMWLCLGTAWIPLYWANNPIAQYLGVALAASHLIGVFAFAANTEELEVEGD